MMAEAFKDFVAVGRVINNLSNYSAFFGLSRRYSLYLSTK